MLVKNILGLNSFFMVNKTLVKITSFESALFLAILADAENIFSGEWIYQTEDTIKKLSEGFLTRRKQEQAIKELESLGVIEKKNMGVPCKRHFRIIEKRLLEVISNDKDI